MRGKDGEVVRGDGVFEDLGKLSLVGVEYATRGWSWSLSKWWEAEDQNGRMKRKKREERTVVGEGNEEGERKVELID